MANRLWPGEDAVGKHFSIEQPIDWTVVGVVGDVRQFGAERKPLSEIYFQLGSLPPDYQIFTRMVRHVVVRTEIEPLGLTGSIREEIAKIDADQPISEVKTTAAVVDSALKRRKFNTLMVGIFAAIGVILVLAGI
jgi:hypothetical protein